MPQTRKDLTWIIGTDGAVLRAICLDAHSPSVVQSFIRRCGGTVQTKTAQVGWDPGGQQMDAQQRHNLLQGVRRNKHRHSVAAVRQSAQDSIMCRVASHHGLTVATILGPIRDPHVARARGHIAHELRSQCHLSLGEIAKTLGLKGHSAIAYWLNKPYQVVSNPSEDSPWISR